MRGIRTPNTPRLSKVDWRTPPQYNSRSLVTAGTPCAVVSSRDFFGAGFDAVAAGDAAEAVDGPLLLRAIDHQRAGGAFLRADGAIDAVVLGEDQLAARAGDGRGAARRDSGWSAACFSAHFRASLDISKYAISPLRTTDAGINRQHQHRHIGQFAALQHLEHRRQVGERRRAHAEALQVLGAVGLDVINHLAARLLGARDDFAIGIAGDFHGDFAGGHLRQRLADEVDGLEQFLAADGAAGVGIAFGARDRLERRCRLNAA